MDQDLSKKNFKIFNWVLIIALLAHIILRVIALYQSWATNEMLMNGLLIFWIIILLSFWWKLFKEESFYYFVIGGFTVAILSDILSSEKVISNLASLSILNWIQIIDLLVVTCVAIYIWAKFFKFELLVKKK